MLLKSLTVVYVIMVKCFPRTLVFSRSNNRTLYMPKNVNIAHTSHHKDNLAQNKLFSKEDAVIISRLLPISPLLEESFGKKW